MVTAPTLPLVPVTEYLHSSWHPDREYVDGVLIERSVPTYFHALLQIIIGAHFRQFEKHYRFKLLPELRTQIIEGVRYRRPTGRIKKSGRHGDAMRAGRRLRNVRVVHVGGA